MAAIDIGQGATDRANTGGEGYTVLGIGNPANDTGTITSFQFWYNTAGAGVKVGTFYGTGTSQTSRDVETIGNVVAGSVQTFSGLNIDVSTNDLAGVYTATGELEYSNSGADGTYYKTGDQFGAGAQTYSKNDVGGVSIYGTGATASGLSIPIARHVRSLSPNFHVY